MPATVSQVTLSQRQTRELHANTQTVTYGDHLSTAFTRKFKCVPSRLLLVDLASSTYCAGMSIVVG